MKTWWWLGLGLTMVGCTEGRDDGTASEKRTVASLLATPPGVAGEKLALDVVVVVSQQNGTKWRAYVQDPGEPNGIGLFCDAAAATPCTATRPPMGATGSLDGFWNPQPASKVEPTGFAATGTGKATYLEASTKAAIHGVSGTPVHLTGGPWRVTDAAPASMANPAHVAGDCASGPPRFGVELVDESDGTKLSLVLKWFDTIAFTTDESSCGAEKTRLANGMRFATLGGLVETSGFGGSELVLEPFADADMVLR